MKYCQKCKVMLKDEVEVCPFCGTRQLPEEEFEAKVQKKKKTAKTLTAAAVTVTAAVLIAAAVIMIFGKEPEKTATDEEYTEEVTDEDLLSGFGSYVDTALKQVWGAGEEDSDSAIEYYETDLPDVAAGFKQQKELKPVAGEAVTVTLSAAVKSEEGYYKLTGEIICDNRKVNYALVLDPSGYVNSLSFELKEETPLQKARYFLLEKASEIQ